MTNEKIKGLNELKNLLGANTDSTDDLKDIKLKALDKTLDLFFNVEDKYGFGKTDIERHLVFPITVMFDYVNNLTPLYNIFLEKKLTRTKFNDFKIFCPEIASVIVDIYIKVLISKSRLGRGEGTQISKSLYESLKESFDKDSSNFNKSISDLSK